MARVVKNEKLEKLANESKEILRLKRTKLFKGFDILKTNMSVGLDTVDEYRWKLIVDWYNDCKDLKSSAFEDGNIPDEIIKATKAKTIPTIVINNALLILESCSNFSIRVVSPLINSSKEISNNSLMAMTLAKLGKAAPLSHLEID